MNRRKIRCLILGHRPRWQEGFGMPEWTCEHCGETGGLQEHQRMPLAGHLTGIIPALIALAVILWLIL